MFFLVLWQWWTSADAATSLELSVSGLERPVLLLLARDFFPRSTCSISLLSEKELMLLAVAGIQVAGGGLSTAGSEAAGCRGCAARSAEGLCQHGRGAAMRLEATLLHRANAR